MVEDAAPAAAPAHGTRRRAAHGLRVLCVEDNPYGRVVLGAVLRELGHRVSFVGSGEAAVETVARDGHDAVLMDVALPGIDGIEATRRIRALPPPAGRIPIIGVSGPHRSRATRRPPGPPAWTPICASPPRRRSCTRRCAKAAGVRRA